MRVTESAECSITGHCTTERLLLAGAGTLGWRIGFISEPAVDFIVELLAFDSCLWSILYMGEHFIGAASNHALNIDVYY